MFAAAVKQVEAAGATAVPVQLADQDEIGAGETPALLAEFKRDLNAYLAATPGEHPADLAGLIAFDEQDPVELAYFGQELFEQAQAATGAGRRPGRAGDPGPHPDAGPRLDRRGARPGAGRRGRPGRDRRADQHPGLADPLPVPGRPGRRVRLQHLGPGRGGRLPGRHGAGRVRRPAGTLPVGVSFFGGRWSDARMLDIAADFEDQAAAREAPGYLPTVGADPAPTNPEPGS